MEIRIDYNTVSFESQINCNDETIQRNLEQTIKDIKNKRITDWFETFISRVKEESNNDTFSIYLTGCDYYEKMFVDSVLEKEGDLLEKKKIDPVNEVSVNRKYSDIDAFVDYSLNSKESIVKEAINPNLDNIANLRSNKVEVPVIATMSSGKSTLLNALIGQDFLFEDTGAATATTCNIKINNKFKKFVAQAIEDETIIEESGTDISAFIKKWNSNANTDSFSRLILKLEGPVLDLHSPTLELNFIDTPGPNSAQNENHKEKTFNYLKDNEKLPIVLYVLDPEKMESDDDDRTLKEISGVLKSDKQNLDRIIFIYNKIDREDLEKKSIDSVLQKIKSFLKKYEIVNPKIFPVSAKYAKLAQLNSALSRNEKGELINYRHKFTPEPEENYCGYQLLEHSPLPNHLIAQLKSKIAISELNADLVYSGIAAIKLYIEDYIINHHQKNQYKDLMGIAYNVFNVIENKIRLEKLKHEKKTAEDQKKSRERTQKEIEELNDRKKEALQEIGKIEPDKRFIHIATKKIDRSFNRLKNKSLQRNDLSNNEAKKLLEEANATISNLLISIKTDLVSSMKDERHSYLLRLKKEVVNKFELNHPSLETKTFNAELLNNTNVLDISRIDDYKTAKVEIKERQKEKEVESSKWYKKLFGLKDTIKYTERYQVIKTVIDTEKFYNDVLDPKSKQFHKIVDDSRRELDDMFLDYNNSFKDLVNHSFDKAINGVYKTSSKELALSAKDKEIEVRKLDKIIETVSDFKKLKYNEKIYREPTVTC